LRNTHTTQICTAFDRQKKNDSPRRITVDVRQITFFDSVTGRPRVWYAKSANGVVELFDSHGYHPTTSEALLPVTKELVAELQKRAAQDEQAEIEAQARKEVERQKAEAAARARAEKERKQQEFNRRVQQESERLREEAAARARAEEERQKKAEARRQAEEERRQAEAVARQRIEEERARAEVAAQRRAQEQELVNSFRRTRGGAMCRNKFEGGQARCDCGGWYSPGLCDFE
jgi:hypothetical protein